MKSIAVNDISGESINKLEKNIRSSFEDSSVYNDAIDRILDSKLNTIESIQSKKIIIKDNNETTVFKIENGLSEFSDGLTVSGQSLNANTGLSVTGDTNLGAVTIDGAVNITGGTLTTANLNCTTNATFANINNLNTTTTTKLDVKILGKPNETNPYMQFDAGNIEIAKPIIPFDTTLNFQSGDFYIDISDDKIKMGKSNNTLEFSNGESLAITNNSTHISGNMYIKNDIEVHDSDDNAVITLNKSGKIVCNELEINGQPVNSGGGGSGPDNSEELAALTARVSLLETLLNTLTDRVSTVETTLGDIDANKIQEAITEAATATSAVAVAETDIGNNSTLSSTNAATLAFLTSTKIPSLEGRVDALETP